MADQPVNFDVVVERDVDIDLLRWPVASEAADDAALAGNHHYADLRAMSWDDVDAVLAREMDAIARIMGGSATEGTIQDELLSGEDILDGHPLFGLDVGVASAVIALSAAGCVPAYSCNGGSFGAGHRADQPIVGFFARKETVQLLERCAEKADVGLSNANDGLLVIYGRNVQDLMSFASAVRSERDGFEIRKKRPGRPSMPARFTSSVPNASIRKSSR